MKKLLITSLISLVCWNLHADVCELGQASAEKVIKINGFPGFFFKVHPSGKYISFIGETSNLLLDLSSGQQYSIKGLVDPVWSPDGSFMVTPEPMMIYKGNEVIEKALANKSNELTGDPLKDVRGVYESIGKKGDGYSMVTDIQGASITYLDKDFKSPTPQKKLCPNIQNIGSDLPMLSKDGRYISFFDKTSISTKIYKLDQENCSLALDLGFPTGKVSFNADSTEISFHMDQFGKFDSGYFSGVGKDKVKNVVAMKLESSDDGKKLNPISWALVSHDQNPGDGSYYPDFDLEGNIYYLEDVGNNFQFVKVPKKALEWRPYETQAFKDCEDCSLTKSPTVDLAALWSKACPEKPSLLNALPLVMGLNPEDCKKMVDDFWTSSIASSKEELLKACPQKESASQVTIGEWDKNQNKDAHALIQSKCIMCHSIPKTFTKDEKIYVRTGPSEKDLLIEMSPLNRTMPALKEITDARLAIAMINSVLKGEMPKGVPLKDAEKNLIMTYLAKLSIDIPTLNAPQKSRAIMRYSDSELQKVIESQTKDFAPGSTKDMYVNMFECTFGQKDCEKYIANQKPNWVKVSENITPERRKEYLLRVEMETRCSNLMNVTIQQCYDFELKYPVKTSTDFPEALAN